MITLTPKKLKERYKKLPDAVKEVYFSEKTVDKLQYISKKHKLGIGKSGIVADEVGLVLLGFTRESEFVSHLVKRLQISTENAERIAGDIEKEIFVRLKSVLKEENNDEIEEINIESNAEPAPLQPETKLLIPPKKLPHKEKAPPQKQPQQESSPPLVVHKEKTRPYSIDPYRESIN